MSTLDRRQFVSGGMLLAGSASVMLARPPQAKPAVAQHALDDAIPAAIGPYRAATAGDIVLPPQDEIGQRIYDRYVARGYVAPDAPRILLLIAYGATQGYGLQLHKPEACYPASGWTLGPAQSVALPLPDGRTIRGVTMEAHRPGRREQVLYWTRIGTHFSPGDWEGRLQILRGAIDRNLPDGVILRLSTPTEPRDGAIRALSAFNRALLAGTGRAGQRLLLGPAA